MKNVFLLIVILLLFSSCDNATNNSNIASSDNADIEAKDSNTDDIVYTVTLRKTAPSRPTDSFAWEIESKQGQLAQSLSALGLYSGNPDKLNEMLGEDSTIMCYSEKDLDLRKVCDKLNLDYDYISTQEEVTITYTQNDINYG